MTESKPWATNGFMGVYRFLDRIWRIISERKIEDIEPGKDIDRLTHKTVKKVTEDTETLNFNTAISQMMVLVKKAKEKGIGVLGPVVPPTKENIKEAIEDGYTMIILGNDMWHFQKALKELVKNEVEEVKKEL